jgi:hypothetical protein
MNWKFWKRKREFLDVGLVDIYVFLRNRKRLTLTIEGRILCGIHDEPFTVDAVDRAEMIIDDWGEHHLAFIGGTYYPMDRVSRITIGDRTSLRKASE